jgi:hypothetical protein
MRFTTLLRPVAALGMLACTTVPAAAVDVTFTANLINSCILSLNTPGAMAVSTDGKTMSSENVGGASAVMLLVSIGAAPTLNFSAPTLVSPAGWSGTPTTSIKYTSLGGANQAFTTTSSTATAGVLIDAFTINTKVENATGFANGNYTVREVVTCQQ